ncbi:MAG: 23S rRNA (uracil(1939)-C(5))-methyltransferase RlmD [Thermovirgaceae bacterium]|nr:23S rRNA (uracil(1939)-C(5))-methyltransferase RlmD [Thermovirgaceae bacterium]
MHPGIMERAEVRVESVNSRGHGVSRAGEEKFVYFVPGALPGEVVRGRVSLLKKSYGVIDIEEITEHHAERISPRCPFYGDCGGCVLQHASYRLQMEIKDRIVTDAFRKIAGVSSPLIEPCRPSPSQWGYRNKASFPVGMDGNKKIPGFFRSGSHDLVPVDVCPVLDPRLERWIGPLSLILEKSRLEAYEESSHSGYLRHVVARCAMNTDSTLLVPVLNLSRADVLPKEVVEFAEALMEGLGGVRGVVANFNSSPGNTIFGGFSKSVAGNPFIAEKMDDFHLKYGPTSFFQINIQQATSLFRAVTGELSESKSERVLELYSGTGALTVFLAQNRKRVHAVEDWPESAGFLKTNATVNSMGNVEALEMSAERAVKFLSGRWFDAVVMDPPRKGCSDQVLKGICSLKPPRIVYISCNPATLARDSVLLMQNGYRLEKIQPFDMFPQTFHIECVATFQRSRKKR